MRMKICLFITLLAACFVSSAISQLPNIGIVVSSTYFPEQADQVSAQLHTNLLQAGRFRLLERQQLFTVLDKLAENMRQHSDEGMESAKEILGVDYFIIARILVKSPYRARGSEWNYYTTSFQLFDVRTSELLAQNVYFLSEYASQPTPGKLSDNTEDWIEDEVIKHFPIEVVPVKVLEMDSKEQPKILLLSQGSTGGIQKDQKLFMFKRESMKDFIRYIPTAQLKVIVVEGTDFSQAEVKDIKQPIEALMVIPNPNKNPYIIRSEEKVSSHRKVARLVTRFEYTGRNIDNWILPVARAAVQSNLLKTQLWGVLDRSFLWEILEEQKMNTGNLSSPQEENLIIAGSKDLLKVRILDVNFNEDPNVENKYTCAVSASYELIDMETGSIIQSQIINGDHDYRRDETKPEALLRTLERVSEKLSKELLSSIGIVGNLSEIIRNDKNGIPELALFDRGLADGIDRGMKGIITMKTKFAGKTINKEIGEFKVDECKNPDYSTIKLSFNDDSLPNTAEKIIESNKYTFKIIK